MMLNMTPPPVNGAVRGIVTHRVQVAGTKACEAYDRLRRLADRLSEEMEEVTAPHGVPTQDLDSDDSLVTTIEAVMASGERR